VLLVDSSVWIDYLRGYDTTARAELRRRLASGDLPATTEPISMELLAGASDEAAWTRIDQLVSGLPLLAIEPALDYRNAAVLYRAARRSGRTVRRLTDCVIAAVAIRHDAQLLHKGTDFDAISDVSPLRARSLGRAGVRRDAGTTVGRRRHGIGDARDWIFDRCRRTRRHPTTDDGREAVVRAAGVRLHPEPTVVATLRGDTDRAARAGDPESWRQNRLSRRRSRFSRQLSVGRRGAHPFSYLVHRFPPEASASPILARNPVVEGGKRERRAQTGHAREDPTLAGR
jgi:predicted nucleic acid-binding protein